MTPKSKAQIKALITLLANKHPAVCDALFQARTSLPAPAQSALMEILTCDVMATTNADAVAAVAALLADVEAA